MDPWRFHSAVRSMYSWQSVAERTERAYQRAMQVGEGVRQGEWARQNFSVSAATPSRPRPHPPTHQPTQPHHQPKSWSPAQKLGGSIRQPHIHLSPTCRTTGTTAWRHGCGGTTGVGAGLARSAAVWRWWPGSITAGWSGGGRHASSGAQPTFQTRLWGQWKGRRPTRRRQLLRRKQSDCRELPEANARQVLTESCLATDTIVKWADAHLAARAGGDSQHAQRLGGLQRYNLRRNSLCCPCGATYAARHPKPATNIAAPSGGLFCSAVSFLLELPCLRLQQHLPAISQHVPSYGRHMPSYGR